jgi:hypothetical protein
MTKALKITHAQPHGEETTIVGPISPPNTFTPNGEDIAGTGSTLVVTGVSPFGPGGAGQHDVEVSLGDVVAVELVDWEPGA